MADPNSLLPPGGGGQMEIMRGGGNVVPPSNKIETATKPTTPETTMPTDIIKQEITKKNEIKKLLVSTIL